MWKLLGGSSAFMHINHCGRFAGAGCAPLCTIKHLATDALWQLLIKTITCKWSSTFGMLRSVDVVLPSTAVHIKLRLSQLVRPDLCLSRTLSQPYRSHSQSALISYRQLHLSGFRWHQVIENDSLIFACSSVTQFSRKLPWGFTLSTELR